MKLAQIIIALLLGGLLTAAGSAREPKSLPPDGQGPPALHEPGEGPGPGRGHGWRGRMNHQPKLTAEQEEELLSFLAERAPRLHERITALGKDSPRYERVLSATWRWYQHWQEMPEE